MSDDICDRLVRFSRHKQCMSTDLEVEAAAEITRLREENARLRETLQYIADPYHNSTTSKDRLAFLARAAIREGENRDD